MCLACFVETTVSINDQLLYRLDRCNSIYAEEKRRNEDFCRATGCRLSYSLAPAGFVSINRILIVLDALNGIVHKDNWRLD